MGLGRIGNLQVPSARPVPDSVPERKTLMRRPKPYLKKSHHAWYVNLNGRPQRLATETEGETEAYKQYDLLMAGRQPARRDYAIAELFDLFLEYHHQKVANGKGSQGA